MAYAWRGDGRQSVVHPSFLPSRHSRRRRPRLIRHLAGGIVVDGAAPPYASAARDRDSSQVAPLGRLKSPVGSALDTNL